MQSSSGVISWLAVRAAGVKPVARRWCPRHQRTVTSKTPAQGAIQHMGGAIQHMGGTKNSGLDWGPGRGVRSKHGNCRQFNVSYERG
jgi:hypothetical protein